MIKKNNGYIRSNGGKIQIDKNSNEPILASSVVVMKADESVVNDGYEGAAICGMT